MASLDEKRLKKELTALFVTLAALSTLAIRPFGFRNFLRGVGNNDLFSVFLLVAIVGISIVMLQRLGIIFSDGSAETVV